MKAITFFSLLSAVLIISSCSKDDSKDDNTEVPTPKVKSVFPSNGSSNIAKDSKVYVLYDTNIKQYYSTKNVTVNGKNANVKISGDTLFIEVSIAANSEYVIVVPDGMIYNSEAASDNKIFAEGLTFSFTSFVKEAVVGKISETAINSSNENVQKVYKFLYDNYGKKIISGSMANVSVQQDEALLVKTATGKTPVMQTIDYIHLQYSWGKEQYKDISSFKTHWQNGGLIAASWHMMCPATESDIITENWQYEDFDAKAALTSGTWQKDFFDKMLSDCAERLKLFKNENIVVIWRPLHEAAGNNGNYNQYGWFWWGKSGAETYKSLWKYMFDYFKSQGLDNLIWVWNSQYSAQTPVDNDWYPGDEYVDIIATDIYERSTKDCVEVFNLLTENWPNKMITLSENGSISNISDIFNAGGTFSYFMPWYTHNLTNLNNSKHANTSWWQDAANCDKVLFLEDMKGW